MASIDISLRISAEEMLRFYGGAAQVVVARADDGRSIQFPARVLRPFVTEQGVQGRFRLEFDEQMRFQAIRRLPLRPA